MAPQTAAGRGGIGELVYLSNLQRLVADAEQATRHRIVQALFEKVEVLGPNEIWLYPSVQAEARG